MRKVTPLVRNCGTNFEFAIIGLKCLLIPCECSWTALAKSVYLINFWRLRSTCLFKGYFKLEFIFIIHGQFGESFAWTHQMWKPRSCWIAMVELALNTSPKVCCLIQLEVAWEQGSVSSSLKALLASPGLQWTAYHWRMVVPNEDRNTSIHSLWANISSRSSNCFVESKHPVR